ncbi:MAG: hypothetical protein R2813_07775 [Flavobacteriales bacterium]
MRTLTTIGLLTILTACNQTDKQADTWTDRVEEYQKTTETPKSIYGQWTIQEIIDSLYTDTIRHRDYFDSTKVDSFYMSHIQKLVDKIRADGNDSTTLFPETPFDKVTGRDAWVTWSNKDYSTFYGPAKTLTKEQTDRLLRVVNNPINFSWGECGTWTASSQFRFYNDGELVRTLDIGCSWQLRTDYEKVKFGTLADHTALRQLCNDIGLKNE